MKSKPTTTRLGSWAAIAFVAALSMGFGQTSSGSTNDSPYRVIIEKNPFRLRPPPPPPVPDIPTPPAVDLKLTGVATLPAGKQAFFRILECNQTVPRLISLAEGEKDGELEVLAINVETARVKVRLHGDVQFVSFETHGIKDAVVKPAVPPQANVAKPAQAP